MLDVLAEAHGFADQAEVFFDRVPGGDGGGGCVGPEEVPAVETGEVLEGAEDFVAAD